MGAVKAVFRSWDNPRANVYRRDNDIPYSWGTAVNVQSMACLLYTSFVYDTDNIREAVGICDYVFVAKVVSCDDVYLICHLQNMQSMLFLFSGYPELCKFMIL